KLDLPALHGSERIERVTEPITGPGLHLDEGDDAVLPRDNVDLLVPLMDIAAENHPARPGQGLGGEAFTPPTQLARGCGCGGAGAYRTCGEHDSRSAWRSERAEARHAVR